jgi:hypothetical protein
LNYQIFSCELQASIAAIKANTINFFWFGPYLLQNSYLSMQSLDFLNVLSNCKFTSENEIELYRLRKNAILQLEAILSKARNKIKQKNLKQLLLLFSDIKIASSQNQTHTINCQKLQPVELL